MKDSGTIKAIAFSNKKTTSHEVASLVLHSGITKEYLYQKENLTLGDKLLIAAASDNENAKIKVKELSEELLIEPAQEFHLSLIPVHSTKSENDYLVSSTTIPSDIVELRNKAKDYSSRLLLAVAEYLQGSSRSVVVGKNALVLYPVYENKISKDKNKAIILQTPNVAGTYSSITHAYLLKLGAQHIVNKGIVVDGLEFKPALTNVLSLDIEAESPELEYVDVSPRELTKLLFKSKNNMIKLPKLVYDKLK